MYNIYMHTSEKKTPGRYTPSVALHKFSCKECQCLLPFIIRSLLLIRLFIGSCLCELIWHLEIVNTVLVFI